MGQLGMQSKDFYLYILSSKSFAHDYLMSKQHVKCFDMLQSVFILL